MINTLNSDAKPVEKLTSVVMSLSMAGMMGANSLKGLDKIMVSSTKSLGQAAASTGLATKVLGLFGVKAEAAGAAAAGSGIALGSLAIYAAAAIAAVAGLAYIIKVVTDLHNKDAIAAERAVEAYKNLSNQANEANDKVEQIISTFEEYDSVVEKLKECDEGTEEWQNTLDDVNKKIWDILETYPELAKFDNLFTEDGLLNKDAIEEFIKS